MLSALGIGALGSAAGGLLSAGVNQNAARSSAALAKKNQLYSNIGNYMQWDQNNKANQQNEKLMRESWSREDNAVQRRVADLRKAGLSPTLAAGSAAQASGPITIRPNPAQLTGREDKNQMKVNAMSNTLNAIQTMAGAIGALQQNRVTSATADLYEARARQANARADTELATMRSTQSNLSKQGVNLDKQGANIDAHTGQVKTQTWLTGMQAQHYKQYQTIMRSDSLTGTMKELIQDLTEKAGGKEKFMDRLMNGDPEYRERFGDPMYKIILDAVKGE